MLVFIKLNHSTGILVRLFFLLFSFFSSGSQIKGEGEVSGKLSQEIGLR
jgi:hypothetical protein